MYPERKSERVPSWQIIVIHIEGSINLLDHMRVRFLVIFYGSYGMFAVTARVGNHRPGIDSHNWKLQRSTVETDCRKRRLELPQSGACGHPENRLTT
jgi:hypothetical protein